MPFGVGCVSSPPRMNARLRWLSLASWLLALTVPLAAQAKLTVEATLVPPTAKPGDTALQVSGLPPGTSQCLRVITVAGTLVSRSSGRVCGQVPSEQ